MGLFSRLFYLTVRQRLPRLKHHYTNGRELDEHDEDVHILLEAGLLRDWSHAKSFVARSKKSPVELYWELSEKAYPNWRKRLKHRLIRALGNLPYDPHKAEIKRLEKGIYNYDGSHSRAHRIMPSPRHGKRSPRGH